MLKKMSFKAKIVSLCVMFSLLAAGVGMIGFIGSNKVGEQYQSITDLSLPKIIHANKMFLEYRRVRITLRTLGLPGITPAQSEDAVKNALDAINEFEGAKKHYLELGFAAGQKEVWEKVDAAWADFKEVGGRVIALQKAGKPEDHAKMVEIFFNDCPKKAQAFTVAGEALLDFHTDTVKQKVVDAKAADQAADTLALLTIVLGTIAGMTIGFIFATSMSKTISQIIDRLKDNASQVSVASNQMASSSQQLSEASTEQAASLEETAASLEEITAMISKASDNAHRTAENSTESQQKAEEGRTSVNQMLTSMDEISQSNEAIMEQVTESNRQMAEIVRVIQEIGNKTKVINEIVFQTKLLSFNASVEAARAGEHGKGFAVVAEEVGNLAQMSGNAAKEITEMLDGSIQRVETIVTDTKTKVEALVAQGKSKVESGISVARQCSETLEEIVKNVANVADLSREISSASKEQSQGVGEINKAMAQLDTVTQQNAATSGEAAGSADSLSTQAKSLQETVQSLVGVIYGMGANEAAMSYQHQASERPAAKPVAKVVQMKRSAKPESRSVPMKAASGDSMPSRDDAGFRDV